MLKKLMSGKLKYLFFFVLCAGLIGGAWSNVSAQTGGERISAGKKPLKPSDIATLIEFHEWIFDTAFTAGERQTFQSFVEKEARRDHAAARRNADEIIKTMAQIRALDAGKQKRVREMTVSDYVADLRKTAGDADSQFLLGIYERGQNGGNAETNKQVLPSEEDLRDAEETSAPPKVGGGAVSPKLVGRWSKSGGLGGAGDGTGKTLYNSGNDIIFEFRADGTMLFINDKNTLSIMQCRITEVTKIPGRYSVSGDTITMNLGAGTVVGTSSCERAGNFKKNLSGDTTTKKFVVKRLDSVFRPDAPLILCLDGQSDDQCLEKSIQ